MNHSYILSFFMVAWNKMTELYQVSYLKKFVHAVQLIVKNLFRKSYIVNHIRDFSMEEKWTSNSLTRKILCWPFTLGNKIKDAGSEFLAGQMKKSIFANLIYEYVNNFLALNTRFLGVFLFSFSIIAIFKGFHWGIVAIAAVGLVLSVFEVNLTGKLDGSLIVKVIKSIIDIDFTCEFYNPKKAGKGLLTGMLAGLLSGAFYLGSPVLGLIGLVPVALGIILLYPKCGVFLAVFAAPIVPTMALVGLCLYVLICLIIKSFTDPDFRWRVNAVGVLVLLLAFVFLINALISYDVMKSIQVFLVYFVLMSMYFVITNTVKTKKEIYSLLKVFVISGTLVALYGFLQYLFGWDTKNAWIDEEMFEQISMRVYSTLENPNVLGEYFLLAIPVGVGLFWKNQKILPKLFYLLCTAAMFVCLILTQSRGCWLGILFAAGVFISFINAKLWGILIVALLLAPMFLPQSIISRFTSIGNLQDSSTSYRVYIWFGTLALLRDFWMYGIGLGDGAFSQVYPFYSYSSIVAPHAHNLFLQMITEVGVLGLIVFLLFVLTALIKMIQVYVRCGNKSENGVMTIAFLSAILGFMLQSMFDYTFYNYRVVGIFFFAIAIASSLQFMVKDEGERLL